MRKFYFLLAIGLLQIASVVAQIPENNSPLFFKDEGIIAHYRMYISFLKSQEKDSILNFSTYHYETSTKKVSLALPYKIDTLQACGDIYIRIYARSKKLDSLITVLIKDKCPESATCEYLTETKLISCEATTGWDRGKNDPNAHCADLECCRVMCLVEVPATTIYVRREILLKRNENGKYEEK